MIVEHNYKKHWLMDDTKGEYTNVLVEVRSSKSERRYQRQNQNEKGRGQIATIREEIPKTESKRVCRGQIDTIKVEETKEKNQNGNSPLHDAANRGDQNAVTLLISLGANVEARNTENETPLNLARNKEVAEILIYSGVDVNSRDSNVSMYHGNKTPLHLVRNKEVAQILIQHGADIHSRDRYKQTPLHVSQDIDIAEIFIQNKADVNSRDSNVSDSALHQAANRGDHRAVKTLISLGANVLARNIEGMIPYDLAVREKISLNQQNEKFSSFRDTVHYLKDKMNALDKKSVTKKKPTDSSEKSNLSYTGQPESEIGK
ncbi:unnamed protein product [Mytilus edulis]|uniref:Uncharacterized protein n=1 Tax=Mytilus edulis TaxID=6550 RepID=A0A8S3SWQ9_MYTED|nr:unnamed protein product [Mytilus edulis]